MTENVKQMEAPAGAAIGNVWSLTLICALGWLIPGLGHFVLKRPKLGVTFLVAITILFFWGLILGAKIYRYEAHQPLTFFALFAQLGM